MNERHNSAPSMPRRARLSVAGVPWHIIQRGNNRAVCFHAEEDYRRYLDDLAEQSRRFGCAIHAYVLMTNHVHLLLTPQKTDSAGQMMKHLGQRYVQYVNRVYRRSGTLWEGRFRSCLTQSEDYVLACYRYIVHAGIAVTIGDVDIPLRRHCRMRAAIEGLAAHIRR